MQALRRRDVLRTRAPERRKLVLLQRAMPSAQARKAAAETRRVDSARATETITAERMEQTSARRRRHRVDHPEEKKLMVTATICRLCENSAIIDPTVAEIVAHQAHPHHKRRANPYWCPAGGIRYKGQLYDPDRLSNYGGGRKSGQSACQPFDHLSPAIITPIRSLRSCA